MAVTRNFSTIVDTRSRSRRGMSISSPSVSWTAMSRAHGTICSGSRAARSFWICRMVSTPPASRSRFSRSETPAPKRCWCRGPTLPSFDPVATWIRQLGAPDHRGKPELGHAGSRQRPRRGGGAAGRTSPRPGPQHHLGLAGIRHRKADGARSDDCGRWSAIAADLGDVDRGWTDRMQRGRHRGCAGSGSAVARDRSIPSRRRQLCPRLHRPRCRPGDRTPRSPQRADDRADDGILRSSCRRGGAAHGRCRDGD